MGYMVCIWFEYGLNMVCIWFVYGLYIVSIWFQTTGGEPSWFLHAQDPASTGSRAAASRSARPWKMRAGEAWIPGPAAYSGWWLGTIGKP